MPPLHRYCPFQILVCWIKCIQMCNNQQSSQCEPLLKSLCLRLQHQSRATLPLVIQLVHFWFPVHCFYLPTIIHLLQLLCPMDPWEWTTPHTCCQIVQPFHWKYSESIHFTYLFANDHTACIDWLVPSNSRSWSCPNPLLGDTHTHSHAHYQPADTTMVRTSVKLYSTNHHS